VLTSKSEMNRKLTYRH